jgi:hypothetical protein
MRLRKRQKALNKSLFRDLRINTEELKLAPPNAGISQGKGGVWIEVTYVISGGMTSPVDAVRNVFCDVVESIADK